jgi:hypothetical protein
MTELPLSLKSTLADYKITPETLWVGFSKCSAALMSAGHPPVLKALYLASSGSAGVQDISRIENRDGGLLGCFSLGILHEITAKLQASDEIKAKHHALSFLMPKHSFVVVVSESGETSIVRATATSLERAMEAVRKSRPNAVLAFGGSKDDLEQLIAEMEAVFLKQDFAGVRRDRRDSVNGWNAQKLLRAKTRPHAVEAIFGAELYPESYR